MSKISITPNPSGTGVFTIASPATNTDRTLTLPDEAGSIVVNTATGIDVTGTVVADNALFSGYIDFQTGGVNKGNIYSDASTMIINTQGTNTTLNTNGGNVGIGTSSPVSGQVGASLDTSGSLFVRGYLASHQTSKGVISFYSTDNTTQIRSYGSTAGSGKISFSTGGGGGSTDTEAMRIDSSGNLLVGTAAAAFAAKQYVESSTNCIAAKTTASANTYEAFVGSRDGNAGKVATWWYNNSSQVGSISITASSTAYVTSSDYRLKTDAQPMTGASARVQALKPVNFEWISDGTRVDGFLAHEAQEIVPECVTGTKDAMRDQEYEVTPAVEATYDDDGNELTAAVPAVMGTRSVPDYQGIDQSKLVPLLTAALQEALTEISALKVRVAALEAV